MPNEKKPAYVQDAVALPMARKEKKETKKAGSGLFTPEITVAPEKPKKDYNSITAFLVDNDLSDLPPLYKCTRCGLIVSSPGKRFYKVTGFLGYASNEQYSNICIDCTRRYYEDFLERYRDAKLAMLLTCAVIHQYFDEKAYDKLLRQRGEVLLPDFLEEMSELGGKTKSFVSTLLAMRDDNRLFIPESVPAPVKAVEWKKADNRNKTYCIRTLGYDPFDDEMYADEDRKFLYNTLSGYLTDDVVEDPHKLNSAVSIVKNVLQINQITKLINHMLNRAEVDSGEVQRLVNTKTALQTSVNATAKANGMSLEGTGKKTTSGHALTAIMKDMMADGFDEAKVNYTSALLDEAYRNVSEQSARALIAELNFTSDEYAKMVGEQNARARELEKKVVSLEEENRLLRLRVHELTAEERVESGYIGIGDGAEYHEVGTVV